MVTLSRDLYDLGFRSPGARNMICGEVLDRAQASTGLAPVVCIAGYGTEHSHSEPGPSRLLGPEEVLYCGDPHHSIPCRADCSACRADCDGTRFVEGVLEAWFPGGSR